LNTEYRHPVAFKHNARGTPAEFCELTHSSEKIPPYPMLLVLNLASLPQGTRSHYKKLLHERLWTIEHNQCKGDRTNETRT